MNTKILKYIKVCSMPALLDLFDAIVDEINKRKAQKED